MPPAKGLFHKAIIQSGAALDAAPRSYATALGGALTDVLGVASGVVNALAAIDSQRIFDSQDAAIAKAKSAEAAGFLTAGFVPSVDGRALPRGPFTPEASALAADIPLIIGTNKDEGTMFAMGGPPPSSVTEADLEKRVGEARLGNPGKVIAALRGAYPTYSPGDLGVALMGNQMFWADTIRLVERKLKQAAPVWMYRMDRELPTLGGRLKAGHATELSYVFGTYDNIRDFVGTGPEPARMSAQMHPAWVAFARNGTPQTPEIPTWPQYDLARRQTMIFNLESRVEADPHAPLRKLLVA
jgi:para-nitrobenzyl esterase